LICSLRWQSDFVLERATLCRSREYVNVASRVSAAGESARLHQSGWRRYAWRVAFGAIMICTVWGAKTPSVIGKGREGLFICVETAWVTATEPGGTIKKRRRKGRKLPLRRANPSALDKT